MIQRLESDLQAKETLYHHVEDKVAHREEVVDSMKGTSNAFYKVGYNLNQMA